MSASGIVIIANENDLENAVMKLKEVNDIDIHTFDYTKVPTDKGESMLFPRNRGRFLQRLKKFR